MQKFNPVSVMFGSLFSVKLTANNLKVARRAKVGRAYTLDSPARAKAACVLDFLMPSAESYVC